MNEPNPAGPQRLPLTPSQPGAVPPRPVIAPGGAQPRPGIQPPAQRLPTQPPQHGGPAQPPKLPTQFPQQGGYAPSPNRLAPVPMEDDELINLEDDDAAPPAAGTAGAAPAGQPQVGIGQIAPGSKIKVNTGGDKHTYTRFKREAHSSVVGATRVRSFHGRLSDDGLAYNDDKINEWLDNHPEVEIKHVNCIVGPLEGKVTGEQGLIVVIWY